MTTREDVERVAMAHGWQPIETAPKDRKVLVWAGSVRIAWWDKDQYAKRPRPMWVWNGPGQRSEMRGTQPTHWMPIPASPYAEEPQR